MSLKSVQIYEIYVNYVLYTSFRNCTNRIMHIINFLYALSKFYEIWSKVLSAE